MIGSSTFIVKKDNTFCAHISGGTIFNYMLHDACKKRKIGIYKLLVGSISKWGKPDADNLTEEDAKEIATATNNINPGCAGYSKFAGDRVFLVDMDLKSVSERDYDNGGWKLLDVRKY